MDILSYKKSLVVVFIILGIGILIFIFLLLKFSSSKNLAQNYQSIENLEVAIESSKISNSNIKNQVEKAKNITVELSQFTINPSEFPITVTTSYGKYQYNIKFTKDGIVILFAPDMDLSKHLDQINIFVSQLIIASSEQKSDKQLEEGTLFDQTVRNDHINYINKIVNDKNLINLTITNIQ